MSTHATFVRTAGVKLNNCSSWTSGCLTQAHWLCVFLQLIGGFHYTTSSYSHATSPQSNASGIASVAAVDLHGAKDPNSGHGVELEQRLPTALIIGAKKCGTRALLEFLRLNPKVAAPSPEVHFFDKHFDAGIEWYRSRMPHTTAEQITLEKSPGYFIDKRAPARVHATNPAMKLILVTRDPVTRAISDYTQAVIRKNPNIGSHSFAELVQCVPVRIKDKHCVKGVNTTLGMVRIGIYHRHLRNWLEYFPLRQLHFVDGERLIKEPYREVRAAERFLGLESAIPAWSFVRDADKGFPCVRQPSNVTTRTNSSHSPSPSSVHCLGKSKGRAHLPVKPSVLRLLRDFYRPESEKFFQLINRRFSWR